MARIMKKKTEEDRFISAKSMSEKLKFIFDSEVSPHDFYGALKEFLVDKIAIKC